MVSRQTRNDVFGDAVSKILLVPRGTHVLKRQHRNRRPQSRRASAERLPLRIGSNVQADTIDADWSLDIFKLEDPEFIKDDVELSNDLLENACRRQDATRLGQRFKARGDVHAVAEDVPVFNDNIAEIDPGAILDAMLLGQVGFGLSDAPL